jgi:hypothetical protein
MLPQPPLLERKMADEIDSLYRLYGSDGVARLSASIWTTYFANLQAWDEGNAGGRREQEEQFDQRSAVLLYLQ